MKLVPIVTFTPVTAFGIVTPVLTSAIVRRTLVLICSINTISASSIFSHATSSSPSVAEAAAGEK
jgi:hypothetical protein